VSTGADALMAVYEFHGDSAEMAQRYDTVLSRVVAISSGRPMIHLAVPREFGFMVVDVWSSESAFRTFDANPEFREVLTACGLPEPKVRVYPVHNLGWPVDVTPLYR
jgi:hypothetical protein